MPKHIWYFFFMHFYSVNVIGYNLDTNFPIIYEGISNASERSSYFGYSVLLNSTWIQIGAPRANFSTPDMNVIEPGVAYHCKFNQSCIELSIGKSSSKNKFSISRGSWFGVAMDFHTGLNGNIVVCGHRWMNASVPKGIPGACFWFQPNQNMDNILNILTPTASVDREKRLYLQPSEYLRPHERKPLAYRYALSQTGVSIHFSGLKEVEKSLLLGAPGVLNWKGSVVKCKDLTSCTNNPTIIDPLYNPEISDFDLFGYAVSSGYFFAPDELMFVAGAPRDASMKGYVLIYSFPRKDSKFEFVLKIPGKNTGEYFGSSIAVADITGDGRDDLVVGAPFFTQNGDEGQIYIFQFQEDKTYKSTTIQGKKANGRFGTAVASVGDLDHDNFGDIAVGAPYEDNGVIYIYYGRSDGLKGPCQRIPAEEIHSSLKGFGISFSGRADTDGNKYDDVAVGSFLSGHAVILRTLPVVTLSSFIYPVTQQLSSTVSKATIIACIYYSGVNVDILKVTRIITADSSYKRASPPFLVDSLTLNVNESNCHNVTFNVMFNGDLTYHSMKFVLKTYIKNTTNIITKQPLMVYQNGTKSGNDGFYLQNPVQKLVGGSSEAELEIPYSLDCENVICQTDLKLKCSLLKNGNLFNTSHPFIIGSQAKYQLKIEVTNSREPSYTTNVEVKFSKEIRLASMPYTCNEKKETIICNLGIIRNKTTDAKHVMLGLDMSSVGQLSIADLHIDVNVTTSGNDVNRVNNFEKISLKLSLDVDAHIYGKSQKDNYPVFKSENGSFASILEVVQIHEVHKKGTSPLKALSLQLKVPIKIRTSRAEIQVVSLNNAEGIIDSKYWDCSADYGCTDCEITSPREFEDTDSIPPQTTRIKRSLPENDIFVEATPPANRTFYINCSMENVKCSNVTCLSTELEAYGKVTLTLEVNVAKLGSLMGQKDIVYISTEGEIKILNPQLTHFNNIQQNWPHTATASSTIIGKIPKKKVDLWIIVASVIGGILLAMVVAMGLAKAGFFQRQTKADLQELKEKARNSHIQSRPTSNLSEEIDTSIELR